MEPRRLTQRLRGSSGGSGAQGLNKCKAAPFNSDRSPAATLAVWDLWHLGACLEHTQRADGPSGACATLPWPGRTRVVMDAHTLRHVGGLASAFAVKRQAPPGARGVGGGGGQCERVGVATKSHPPIRYSRRRTAFAGRPVRTGAFPEQRAAGLRVPTATSRERQWGPDLPLASPRSDVVRLR